MDGRIAVVGRMVHASPSSIGCTLPARTAVPFLHHPMPLYRSASPRPPGCWGDCNLTTSAVSDLATCQVSEHGGRRGTADTMPETPGTCRSGQQVQPKAQGPCRNCGPRETRRLSRSRFTLGQPGNTAMRQDQLSHTRSTMSNVESPEESLDCIGLFCPEPLFQTREVMDDLEVGRGPRGARRRPGRRRGPHAVRQARRSRDGRRSRTSATTSASSSARAARQETA